MIDQVSALLCETASSTIMPRFRGLAAGDIEEKSPGEVVTIADREAEILITPRLLALCNGSRVVGEEATALNPSLLADLDDGAVWLVDPLDGTANFAAGRSPFALMVALLSHGEMVAAWMLDPLSGTIAVAERGAGAWIDGRRIATTPGSPGPACLRGAVFTRFMPSEVARAVLARTDRIGEALPGLMCCGAEYPTIAAGEEDFALFWRTLPWDHAPGVLFLNEAGGYAARPSGAEYRPGSGEGGLLAARNREVWEHARSALLG